MPSKQEVIIDIEQEHSVLPLVKTKRSVSASKRNIPKTRSSSHQLASAKTNSTITDFVLAPLAAAAEAMSERAYLQACSTIDWQERKPEEFIQAIQYAFASGAHMAARQLANQGATIHPEHSELQKYARILAPPRVIARNLPPDPSAKANRDWLINHSTPYRGRWVAVRNGTLLKDSSSLQELTTQFGVTPDILYTRVP